MHYATVGGEGCSLVHCTTMGGRGVASCTVLLWGGGGRGVASCTVQLWGGCSLMHYATVGRGGGGRGVASCTVLLWGGGGGGLVHCTTVVHDGVCCCQSLVRSADALLTT